MAMAIGYGSGVMYQTGYDYGASMPLLDMIFVVDDAEGWHRQNYDANRGHYRGMAAVIGPDLVSKLTRGFFPVAFFPHVDIVSGIQGKYGVVESQSFVEDLTDWRWMTLAGRLQKPIKKVSFSKNQTDKVEDAMKLNLQQALSLARVMESRSKSLDGSELDDIDLVLKRIVGLSYMGDLRTKVGAESENKQDKILDGNKEKLIQLYKPLIIQAKEHPQYLRLPEFIDISDSKEIISKKISTINSRSSVKMALNQFMLDSPSRNFKYIWAKLRKGIFK